jgi:hypothetical protein
MLVRRQQPDSLEHFRMGQRSPNIVRVEPVVEANTLGKRFHATIGRLTEYSGSSW